MGSPGRDARRGWSWAGASVTGTSHAASRTPCQDSFQAWAHGAGSHATLILAACDGAGSSRRAAAGSALAADAFMSAVETALAAGARAGEIPAFAAAAEAAAAKLAETAHAEGAPVADYATTLVACVAGPDGATIVHVGDGACALRMEGGSAWAVPSWPAAGEYAGTTDFLTDRELRIRCVALEGRVEAAAVFTDGIERLALEFASGRAHTPFFDAMIAAIDTEGGGLREATCADLAAFLGSARVNARTDDDKTLLLARRARTGGGVA